MIFKIAYRYVRKSGIKAKAVVLGMIIATMMFTSILIITESMTATIQNDIGIRYGNYTIQLAYADENIQNQFIKEYCQDSTITKDLLGFTEIVGEPACLFASSDGWYECFRCSIVNGRYPINQSEIIIPENSAMSALHIGDKVTLEVCARNDLEGDLLNECYGISEDEIVSPLFLQEYEIVGFYEKKGGVSIDKELDWFCIYTAGNSINTSHSYIYSDVIPDLDRVEEDYSEYVSFNNNYLSAIGISKTGESTRTIILLIQWVLIIFVSVAVVVFIGNASLISYKERYREIGNFLANGATSGQICLMLLAETLIMSLISIPIGVVCGLGIIKGTINLFAPYFSRMAYIETEFIFVFNVKIVLLVVLVVFTVSCIAMIMPIVLTLRIAPIDLIREQQAYVVLHYKRKTRNESVFRKIAKGFQDTSKEKGVSIVCTITFTMVALILTFVICNGLLSEEESKYASAPYDLLLRMECNNVSHFENTVLKSIEAENDISNLYYIVDLGNEMFEDNSFSEAFLEEKSLTYIAISDENFSKLSGPDTEVLLCGNTVDYIVTGDDYLPKSNSIFQQDETLETVFHGERIIAEKIPSEQLFAIYKNLIDLEGCYVIFPLTPIKSIIVGENMEVTLYLSSDNHSGVFNNLSEKFPDAYMYDLAAEHEHEKVSIVVVRFFVTAFLILIFVISFINLFFSIIYSILLRATDYALLISLGTSDKQIRKIIIYEYVRELLRILFIGNILLIISGVVIKKVVMPEFFVLSIKDIVLIEALVCVIYIIATSIGCIKAENVKKNAYESGNR